MEKVAILLSTYNGERYLPDQLDSILNQRGIETLIFIRDDGSNDGTKDVLLRYKRYYNNNIVLIENDENENIGVAKSFFFLLRYVFINYPEIEYFSFADQDDVWFEDKVIRALTKVKEQGDKQVLYFSKKRIVDEQLSYLKRDIINWHEDFWSFFDRSNASGCTMLLNKKLVSLLMQADLEEVSECLHDAFILRVAICVNAKIVYDDSETMLYRQHGNNVVGTLDYSLLYYLRRGAIKLFSRRKHYLKRIAERIIDNYGESICMEYMDVLKLVIEYDSGTRNKIKLSKRYLNNQRSINDKIRFMVMIWGALI